MTQYSKISEINILIKDSVNIFKENDFKIINSKDINYGNNITFSYEGSDFLLTLYYTSKNGFRFVFPKETPEEIQQKIKSMLLHNTERESDLVIPFEKYIGMDEAGKGDYFGALVLAGFIYDRSIERDLLSLEVGDSKSLSDQKIHSIANSLMLKYPERVKIKELKPEEYNSIYAGLKKKGKNLNHMLAYSYKELIDVSISEHGKMGIIIDKFAGDEFIRKIILKENSQRELILIENAERDLAVASASILARAIFLKSISELSGKYNFNFPLGGGENVVIAAKEFYRKRGDKALYAVSKDHFKITGRVLGSLF